MCFGEGGRRFLESLGIAPVEVGVGELALLDGDDVGEAGDFGREGFERLLVLEVQLLGRSGGRGAGGLARAFGLDFGSGGALQEHVAIAAGVFDPLAGAFGVQGAGDDAVEEVAVVAHQEDGARVFGKHVLQEIEGFEVEVVGGFVEDEEVAGPCHGAGKKEAAAFAAGEDADGGSGLFGLEQEILHVADDVAAFGADLDGVAATGGEGVGEGGSRVEGGALLVEGDGGEVGADGNCTGVGLELAGEEVEEGGLTGAVGADDAEAVTAQDAQGEVVNDWGVGVGFGDVFGDGNELAGEVGFGGGEAEGGGRAAGVAAFLAEGGEFADPADVALASGGDAVAHPVLLAGDLATELVEVTLGFGFEVVAPGFEMGKPAVDAAGRAGVEPDEAAAEGFEQAAVVADEDDAGAEGFEFGFEPFDGGEVEVVGGFVEEEEVGRGGEGAGEGGAALLAAGEGGGMLGAVEAEAVEEGAAAVGVVVGA